MKHATPTPTTLYWGLHCTIPCHTELHPQRCAALMHSTAQPYSVATALRCAALLLRCTATALHCAARYCTAAALHCYCAALRCTAVALHCYCAALCCTAVALHCYCAALRCTVLHGTAPHLRILRTAAWHTFGTLRTHAKCAVRLLQGIRLTPLFRKQTSTPLRAALQRAPSDTPARCNCKVHFTAPARCGWS